MTTLEQTKPDASAGEKQAEGKDAAPAKEKDEATELLKAILFAAVIALFIRSFLFEPFNIPSGSMLPTLQVGDYLFVEKFSYGYSKFSFPLDAVPIDGRVMESMPARGDIVVFRKPSDTDIDYIKRVIGLPGDHIQMKEGRLYINGKMVERKLVGTEDVNDGGVLNESELFVETLPGDAAHPGGVKHHIYEISDDQELDNTPEYVVPDGHYFMMGDNRDQSADSRVPDVRFVPAENLVGKAVVLFFSTDGIQDKCHRGEGAFAGVKWLGCALVEWPKAARYSRFFRSVYQF